MISENGHFNRNLANDIHKSIGSARNVHEKKSMALVKMSKSKNKTGHIELKALSHRHFQLSQLIFGCHFQGSGVNVKNIKGLRHGEAEIK